MAELPDSSVLVLVVDDEVLIQTLIQDLLVDGGFATVGAVDGPEALLLIEAQAADFRAIVTDIRMGP